MKTTCCTIICLTTLAFNSALSQQPPGPTPGPGPQPPSGTPAAADFSSQLQGIIAQASKPAPEPTLTRFNLDFPGGTPKELVAAIEKATGRLVNAIVKDEFSNTKLPALKMTSVTVPQLFEAFVLASRGSVTTGGSAYSTEYGFKTPDKPSDDSIWYFYAYKAPPPAKVCRFYSLAAYLDRGFSVDDITTAIETGWRLLGVTTGSGGFFGGGGGGARGGEFQPPTSPPTISFHKDTKLLIAVGERDKLEIIDDVLKALGSSKPSHAATAPAPAAQPAETPKPEK